METPTTFHTKTWVGYNSLGWILGMVLLFGVAIIGESFGEDHQGGQSAIGIGLGTGMGLMQWLYLKKCYGWPITWLWFAVIGFSGAFLLYDGIASIWSLKPEQVLPFFTLLGGMISGFLQQQFILRKHMKKPLAWMFVNAFTWLFVHLLTGALFMLQLNRYDVIPRPVVLVMAFTFLLIGGPIIGFLTARYFTKMQK